MRAQYPHCPNLMVDIIIQHPKQLVNTFWQKLLILYYIYYKITRVQKFEIIPPVRYRLARTAEYINSKPIVYYGFFRFHLSVKSCLATKNLPSQKIKIFCATFLWRKAHKTITFFPIYSVIKTLRIPPLQFHCIFCTNYYVKFILFTFVLSAERISKLIKSFCFQGFLFILFQLNHRLFYRCKGLQFYSSIFSFPLV